MTSIDEFVIPNILKRNRTLFRVRIGSDNITNTRTLGLSEKLFCKGSEGSSKVEVTVSQCP
uniref:Uncharacterized protein n=1 Tax=Lepeophtheirus salmonis TaxID=72036 RepID=A0A0K2U8C7_LEPSM